MDDLPLQQIQISGPTLASLLQRFSSSPGDVDGLLFGHFTHITSSTFADDDPTSTTANSSSLVATITSFFSSNSTSTFYDSTGDITVPSLRTLLSSHHNHHHSPSLLGWFSGRRKTPLRPSLRETSVTASLSSNPQFSSQVDNNSPIPYTLPPSIFLLLTTPVQDQLIHTLEHRAYQFRSPTNSFELKTLDVVNLGPSFRGHYGAFCPNSPFPQLPTQSKSERSESLKGMRRVSKDQKEMDMCAEEFEVARLGRLVGPDAANYAAEMEDLYGKMLAKLDGLARLVEKSSARVLEQENHNMKLRCKVAGLE